MDFQSGDVFGEDYYIHRNGERHHKYFTFRMGWKHYWPPILVQVARIEALYHRLTQRMAKRNYWHIVNAIAATPERKAHAKPLHEYQGKDNPKYQYWEYKVEWDENYQANTYSFDWIAEPKVKINPELGQQLYHWEYTMSPRLLGPIRNLLEDAIEKYLRSQEYDLGYYGEMKCDLQINGRLYMYLIKTNSKVKDITLRKKYNIVSKIAWPGDKHTTLVL